jgi:hypothetical protein
MKPSEMKVHTIQRAGGPTITLEQKKPHHPGLHEHEPADPKWTEEIRNPS